MKILATNRFNTEQRLAKFLGKDLWLFCFTDYGRYYIQPIKLERGFCVYHCMPYNYAVLDAGELVDILTTARSVRIDALTIYEPVQVYSTQELIEPQCEALGLDVEDIMRKYSK